jgi:hypothetical protein
MDKGLVVMVLVDKRSNDKGVVDKGSIDESTIHR